MFFVFFLLIFYSQLILYCFRGHLEDIYDLCWSADGKFMISGSVDNSAILWDLTKGRALSSIIRIILR